VKRNEKFPQTVVCWSIALATGASRTRHLPQGDTATQSKTVLSNTNEVINEPECAERLLRAANVSNAYVVFINLTGPCP